MSKDKLFQPAYPRPICCTRDEMAASFWEKIMSPEERQLLQGVFDRMRNNSSAPRDNEADHLIADNVRQQPYSPYFLTQAVIVQEQALQAANQRIQQLEQQSQSQQGQSSGGFLSSIFGGGGPSRPSVPAPSPAPVWNQGGAAPGGGYGPQGGYPQQPQQGGPWGGAPQMGGGGGGFLHGALQTAAGVAGGALLFDGIRGLMGGHGSPFGIGAGMPGGGMGGSDTVVNNYYGDSSSSGSDADYAQDANQDADSAQDASDYGVDDNSSY